MPATPATRIRAANAAPVRAGGRHVLYWMIAARRTRYSFGLQRALELAREQNRPLIVLEALRCAYPHASDRFQRFILDGMADNAAAFAGTPVAYHPYVEPSPGAGRGLLAALAEGACAVVTDEYPTFFLPRMVKAAAARLDVRLEVVDSLGLLPLSASERVFPTAHSFRRFLQAELRTHLGERPTPNPLARARLPQAVIPPEVGRRWPAATAELLAGAPGSLAALPIDHGVAPCALRGGSAAAREALGAFVRHGLAGYDERRNHPDDDGSSGLSPWLHFGQLSAHAVFEAVVRAEGWDASRLSPKRDGSRSGWWGMSASAEAFLDQLVTWRELGHGNALRDEEHASYDGLPGWAQATLRQHAQDPRPWTYTLAQLAGAATHDELWNAAQRQLVAEGRIHGYLRMLWGKRILEWSASPRAAFAAMVELNDRFALDGRDPNSYSSIAWVLGRYDRAWGPERPIVGKVRYMASANTLKKLRCGSYLRRYGAPRADVTDRSSGR